MTTDPHTLLILGYPAEAARAEIENLREELIVSHNDERGWVKEVDGLRDQVEGLTCLVEEAEKPCPPCSRAERILQEAITAQASLSFAD